MSEEIFCEGHKVISLPLAEIPLFEVKDKGLTSQRLDSRRLILSMSSEVLDRPGSHGIGHWQK